MSSPEERGSGPNWNHPVDCECKLCGGPIYDSCKEMEKPTYEPAYKYLTGDVERLKVENKTLKSQIEELEKERDELKAWVRHQKAPVEPSKKIYYIYFKKYDLNLSQRFRDYVEEHRREIRIISMAPVGRSAIVEIEAMSDIIQKMLAGGEFDIEGIIEDCTTLLKGE